jgi:hypothetical protein
MLVESDLTSEIPIIDIIDRTAFVGTQAERVNNSDDEVASVTPCAGTLFPILTAHYLD